MKNNLIKIIRRFQRHHALQEERARTWAPAPSDFKVPNEADQKTALLILGFNESRISQSSQHRRES